MVLQMNRLPDSLSDSFQKGKFVAKLTDGAFNCVWIDYVLEVTENKALKSSGGIVGITHNDSALMRWFLSRPLTAKYATEFQSGQKTSHHDPGKHHTDTPYHRKSYNESVGKMLQVFEEDTFIDPFCLTSPPSTLVNMATGVPATPDVAASLLGCHTTGEKMLDTFVRDRFQVKGEQPPKKKFFDPLPRTKVKTMGATKAAVQIKAKSLNINGEEMYLRLLAINAYKKVPLERVVSFENAPVPLSMFTDDGSMCVTKKSDFMQKLEVLAGPEHIIRDGSEISNIDCIVFDGMAIVQMLQPKSAKSTYQQMAEGFWSYILSQSAGVSNLHIVFDRYEDNSVKIQTRERRGENISSIAPVSIQPNMVIGDWKRVLTSTKSKCELTKLYTRYITQNCHCLLRDGVQVFVSGGLKQKVLRVTNEYVAYVDALESTHEEADTRMLLHLVHASSVGAKNAVLFSPDTDVLVLLVHHFDYLGLSELYFRTGTKGIHFDNTRYIKVHIVHSMLS